MNDNNEFVADMGKIQEMLEKHGDKSEEELLNSLMISMLENSTDTMKDMLTAARAEQGLPPATDEDIADMLEHVNEISGIIEESKEPSEEI